jgi:hypothetical protein
MHLCTQQGFDLEETTVGGTQLCGKDWSDAVFALLAGQPGLYETIKDTAVRSKETRAAKKAADHVSKPVLKRVPIETMASSGAAPVQVSDIEQQI